MDEIEKGVNYKIHDSISLYLLFVCLFVCVCVCVCVCIVCLHSSNQLLPNVEVHSE